MKITKELTIADLQVAFHEKFPGLKLEFYKKAHEDHEGSSSKSQLGSAMKLGEAFEDLKEGEMTINEEMTVWQLEKAMEDQFGVHAQVFRRSNQIWLQTSTTDDWTIKEQNRKGLASIQ